MATPIFAATHPARWVIFYSRFVIDVRRAIEFVSVIMVSTHFQVALPSRFVPKLVAASARSTCAVSYGDSTVCWGLNTFGDLGLGHTNHVGDQTDEMGDHMEVTELGSDFGSIAQIEGMICGFCAVSTVGIKCWGRNDYGQLGM